MDLSFFKTFGTVTAILNSLTLLIAILGTRYLLVFSREIAIDMDVEDHLSSGFWSMDLEPRDTQQAIEQLDIRGDGAVAINEEAIATAPKTTETSKASRVTEREKQWEFLKDDIQRLYVEEGKTLPATMAAIQKMCDFAASPRTWKTKIKKWGFEKYVSKKDMMFVVAKANQRTIEGKETVFYYRGLEIAQSKIENFRRRQKTTGTSISSPQNTATPCFITYGNPKIDEPDAAIVDERQAEYRERDGPLDASGGTARSKDGNGDSDLATISTTPHMLSEISGTSFSNDLLLARCDQLLRSWVRTKTEGYPLLLLLENFHFEGILLDMDKSMDPSDLTLEFLLKRWMQHENKDICARCMSSTDESLCIGGILASAEIPDQRINKCRKRLLGFLEQAPVEHASFFAKITTYFELRKLYGDYASKCRMMVALVQLYFRHQPDHALFSEAEAESLLIGIFATARILKDPHLQFKYQLMLARYHIRKNRYPETIDALSRGFTDYLTINSTAVNRTERFDKPILCVHTDPPDVECKLMSSLASFSEQFPHWNSTLCWEDIEASIHRVWELVERNNIARFCSNKDHFKLRTEIATIASVISKLGFLHEAQSLFHALINAADPEDINEEEVMELWNVKIYTHVLHYVHGIHGSSFAKEQYYEKKALCSSLIYQAATFLTATYLKGNMVHDTVAEQFNKLQDMFAGFSPIDPFPKGDRSGRIGDLQSQEPQTELFPHMAPDPWTGWDKTYALLIKNLHALLIENLHALLIENLLIDEFDDLPEVSQNDPTAANIPLFLPHRIAPWNESGELEDVLAPLGPMAAASAGSGYRASRSKGSIISESRMSTNSTSSGMKSIKYGVTYSEGSVMSLDLTELFP